MPFGLPKRLGAAIMLLGLGGCAAPIKALMGETQSPTLDPAVLQAAHDPEAQRRVALMEKGRALLNGRASAGPSGAMPAPDLKATKPALAETRRGQGPSPAVAAMLGRAKLAEPARQTGAEKADLTRYLRVKDETRFRDSPAGSPERRPDSIVIRFAPGAPALDAEGNRALAELARRSELSPVAKIVLVAGLAGTGTPWERMQAASERLEVVARHVPPPLRVEKRFELELENQQMRLELHREAR